MSNDIVLEERVHETLDVRQVNRQMEVIRESAGSPSHSDFLGLTEPAFIRRSTCFDADCGVIKAGYIFL